MRRNEGEEKMNEYILQCYSLVKKFGKKAALDGVDLKLKRGKTVGLLGPNGSGKTTLIKTANGLLQPTSGTVYINDTEPSPATRRVVSYLPDKNCLDEKMTVGELIRFFADFYEDFQPERAEAMTESLGIDKKDKLKTLSKGNREKVQLILVMSRKAELYLLDEPIGGVDPATRDYILESIVENRSEDATVVISTHLIADVEKVLDEVIFLKDGKIVLHDEADAIREREGKSIDELFREVFRC